MRVLFTVFIAFSTLLVFPQANRGAKMAAVFLEGYYINNKNDTVRGQIQANPNDPTDFYRQFAFLSGKSKKPKMFLAKNTKAYGFEGRHFVMLTYGGEKFFVERLTNGRLAFYEHKFNGKIDGYPAVESVFFIKDLYAEGEKAELKIPKKISNKFYKKSLKPYLEDQPVLWTELDKYNFNKDNIVHTINEFNEFYAPSTN